MGIMRTNPSVLLSRLAVLAVNVATQPPINHRDYVSTALLRVLPLQKCRGAARRQRGEQIPATGQSTLFPVCLGLLSSQLLPLEAFGRVSSPVALQWIVALGACW